MTMRNVIWLALALCACASAVSARETDSRGADASAFAEESLEIISGRALGSDAQAWEDWFRGNESFLVAHDG